MPPMRMLLASKVPDKPGVGAMLQQRLLLGGSGLKPKPHVDTLWITTDIPGRERRFPSGHRAGVFTPQIG
jgi:hypothetical protein